MPDWLQNSLAGGQAAPASILLWRIGAAYALGAVVAGIYRWARRGQSMQPTFLPTLVLLAGTIAMATQVIGDNVARAFSLVGALSVVRFRTVVKDTQDTAFVILAVVVGMACGANNLPVALAGLGVTVLAGLILWPPGRDDPWSTSDLDLTIRTPVAPEARISAESVLSALASRAVLMAVSTAKQGASIDQEYRVRLRPGVSPAQVVSELNAVAAVESVDLKRPD